MFDISPSRIDLVLWSNSQADIRMRMNLRAGFEQVRLVQHYQSMGAIARQLFGTKDSKEPQAPQPRNFGELNQMFGAVFGNGR